MIDTVLGWLAQNWLEVGSNAIALAALILAYLAYRLSKLGHGHAKMAELNALRIQAKEGLHAAQQSQVTLQLACQDQRAKWASHERKQRRMLTAPMWPFEPSPIDRVEHEGSQLLAHLTASAATVDKMNLQELEDLLQRAKMTALEIQTLAGRLEPPT